MALTIYGSSRSRTMRVLWTAAELGLSYNHVSLAWDDPTLKSPEFLRLNPAGAIPMIVDDGYALAESMAINLFLAKKYGAHEPQPLYPGAPAIEAQLWRWSLWAQGHIEPWVQRDDAIQALHAATGSLRAETIALALASLNRALERSPWLVADHFTVADLNVAGVLSPSRAQSIDFTDFPQVREWLQRCYARPAAREVRLKFG